ncbi:MAG: hypothetical protein JXB06_14935, partial [Spirochaetales bacterium]|nr:hypothetical protein [Spirochaetales bacterium]
MKSYGSVFCILLAAFTILSSVAWAQEGGAEETELLNAEEHVLTAPETRIEPVFPEENEALIFIEGEEAVS